jgi:hypothetical protein
LSKEAIVVLNRANKIGPFVFSIDGAKSFQEFSRANRCSTALVLALATLAE